MGYNTSVELIEAIARKGSVAFKHFKILGLVAALLIGAMPFGASASGKTTKKAAPAEQSDLAKAHAKLEQAVDEYKQSLSSLITPLEQSVTNQSAKVDKLKELVETGIVARREVEDAERALAEAQAKLADAKKQLVEADVILEEAEAAEQLALAPIPSRGGYIATPAVIRYQGSAWHISDIGKVEGFFASHFARTLPISAYGQTSLHNKLGFDHTNSVDVAVHPDSAEGQALIAYLRSAGIPFLAFRSAVPGKATGPHIHIGFPSHRFR